MPLHIRKPTKEELRAAEGKTVPDLIALPLRVLFCGINPGLYSAATGHHFARPGNRFWPALHHSGFTTQLLSPFDERELLPLGCGITNIVERATAAADELSSDELRTGRKLLEAKVRRYRPKVLAILGISAYRSAFAQPKARLGRQSETIGETVIWILPNPSGLNAHYQPKDLARLFQELRLEVERLAG
ncbi:MAG: double-stranded uracil-DNA glycosylase [Acidobacteriota bacterium]|jgi:TDG/mug DNA glycosylase family protein|nr:double-stranded uracil-DNA glycosylase [Acidobacteriota bacterium]